MTMEILLDTKLAELHHQHAERQREVSEMARQMAELEQAIQRNNVALLRVQGAIATLEELQKKIQEVLPKT